MTILNIIYEIFKINYIPEEYFIQIRNFYKEIDYEVIYSDVNEYKGYKLLGRLEQNEFDLETLLIFIAKYHHKYKQHVKFIFVKNANLFSVQVFITYQMNFVYTPGADPIIDESYQYIKYKYSEISSEDYQNFCKSSHGEYIRQKLNNVNSPTELLIKLHLRTRGTHKNKPWYNGCNAYITYYDWSIPEFYIDYYKRYEDLKPDLLFSYYVAVQKAINLEFSYHNFKISLFTVDQNHIPFFIVHDEVRAEKDKALNALSEEYEKKLQTQAEEFEKKLQEALTSQAEAHKKELQEALTSQAEEFEKKIQKLLLNRN